MPLYYLSFFFIISAYFVNSFVINNNNLIYDPKENINLINDTKEVLNFLKKSIGNNIKTLGVFTSLFEISNPLKVVKEIKDEWKKFKIKFKKVYSTLKEESERFLSFLNRFIMIKRHNALYKSGKVGYSMALNHLSDLSESEYSSLLGLKSQKEKVGLQYLSPMTKSSLPDNVDWRSMAVTEVKDQGICGSCWAFSTTGSLEGQQYRKTKKLVSLSEQQLVDCSLENDGCNGGLMDNAFDYIKENGGIDKDSSYVYVSGKLGYRENTCNYTVSNIGATASGFVDIEQENEEQLKEAVALIGPISVGIDANHLSFMNYNKGIYEEPQCSSEKLDHGVLVVGYGVDEVSGVKYWLVKNSWSTVWGEKGYIKMRRDFNNMCGIASMASYPLV